MKFGDSDIAGCRIIDIDSHADERGMFARTWCAAEFEDAGLPANVVQCSISRNSRAGTTRGLHFQLPPSREGKLVRCSRGGIVDVVVDLRPNSATFLERVMVELTDENCRGIYIPFGCAHGFQTLTDDTDVYYQMTDFYAPELSAGLRWNDPALGVAWPRANVVMNDRDRSYPDLDEGWLRSLDWA
jgi:dTDP-4-dehydrorhamnose 3,5-epimerase